MPYNQRVADFNETTYSMHLTNEIQNHLKRKGSLDGAAIYPTLRDEADLGYDVSIPAKWGLLYLQFKISEYMRRSNASEFDTFEEPYFRFSVKTDATTNGMSQHNVLCALENRGESVYYAAPAFLTHGELNEFALRDGMFINSVFPKPNDLGMVDIGSRHKFAFTGVDDVRAFSDPGPTFSGRFEILESKIRGKVAASEARPLELFLRDSLDVLSSYTDTPEARARDWSRPQRLAILSNSMGLQPFLLRERQD